MEDILIGGLSLKRLIEVAIIVVPLFLYIHHGMDSTNKRIDATIAASNARLDATIAAGNARADALWQEFITLKRAEQK